MLSTARARSLVDKVLPLDRCEMDHGSYNFVRKFRHEQNSNSN